MRKRFGVLLVLLGLLGVACTVGVGGATPIPDSNLLFADQFVSGETGLWRIEGDEVAASFLSNEQMHINVNEAQTAHYVTLDREIFSDFVLDIETALLEGNPENSFGVLFRMVDAQHFYRFEMTGNGLFIVEKRDGETFSQLTSGWLDATHLVQGIGAMNRVQIRAIGDTFTFLINDEVEAEILDATYASGNVALDAGTFARPGITVAFDNLIITRP